MIYLDNAATTPIAPEVLEVMSVTAREHYGNPSSVHKIGRESRVIIEEVRRKIASYLNVTPAEIIFTSGGTEAVNLVINGCVFDLGIKNIITSPLEHPAVINTLKFIGSRTNLNVMNVELGEKGKIVPGSLESLLKRYPDSLVILMHANNEIGNMIRLDKVSKLCKKYNALYLADTVQTIGKYELDFNKTALDFACCSAHKIHGPKGIGFLFLNKEIRLSPLIFGGGQERNMRAGTENIAGIAGMGKAMEIAHDEMWKKREYILSLKAHMVELFKNNIDDIRFNGESEDKGLNTVLNVSFPKNEKSELLLFKLDMAGIAASGGSACHSGDESISYVLKSIGSDPERTSIRFSFSRYNTMKEIEQCVTEITRILSD